MEGVDRRAARLGQPLGPRPAGLAYRVLGYGRGPSRGDDRHPRRRPRSEFPAPRKRDRPERSAHDGAPLARFWMHNGFLDVEREKMSKSLGNVVPVRDLLREAPGEAIRDALLVAHYRKPWTGARRASRAPSTRSTASI